MTCDVRANENADVETRLIASLQLQKAIVQEKGEPSRFPLTTIYKLLTINFYHANVLSFGYFTL